MDCSTDPSNETLDAKLAMRSRFLARRRSMPANIRGAANRTIQQWVMAEILTVPKTVAAYSPLPTEPGGVDLPDLIRSAGHRVLLPVLRDDLDLEWAEHTGALAPTRRGLAEPTGASLGVEAITSADIVLVPGLAAGIDGARLGRGGGSYDRALARVRAAPVVILLFDGEWPQPVPSDRHDIPVTHVLTPTHGVARVENAPR